MEVSYKRLPCSDDIFQKVQYESFCRQNRELHPLLFTVAESKQRIKAIRDIDIPSEIQGTKVYLSLRNICPYWYDTLSLDDPYHITYVVVMVYGKYTKKNSQTYISADIPVYGQHYVSLDNYIVTFYRCIRELQSSMVLIDEDYLSNHPAPPKPPQKVLDLFPKKPLTGS